MNGSFIGYCFITVLEKKKEAVLSKFTALSKSLNNNRKIHMKIHST
jgi:hypothetical protein